MKGGNSQQQQLKNEALAKMGTKTSLYVRQIWLGGLPFDITEKALYKYFFIFGEIQNIELRADKSFAFIKYYTVKAATHAADWANTTTVFKDPLKVSFSDQSRRRHVLGDKPKYSLHEGNCKTLVVLYSKNAGTLPSSETIGSIFSQYGHIKGLYIKETPQNITRDFPFLRSSILVDYDKVEEAQDARSDLFQNDAFGTKRRDLGDKECQINFALPKYLAEVIAPEKNEEALEKFSERDISRNALLSHHQETNSLILSLVNNEEAKKLYEDPIALAKQIRDVFNAKFKGQQREAGVNPLSLPAMSFPGTFPGMPGTSSYLGQRAAPTVAYDPAQSPNMGAPTFPPHLAIRPNFMGQQGPGFNMPGQPGFPAPMGGPPPSSAPNLNKLLESLLGVKKEEEEEQKQNEKKKQSQEKVSEQEKIIPIGEVLSNDNNIVWSGQGSSIILSFITRMGKSRQRVGVDAYQVFGDSSKYLIEYNLNITARTQCEEAMKRMPLAVVVFMPNNETQFALFKEYMNYFSVKDRAGVIELKKSGILIYMLPQNQIANKFFPEERNEAGVLPQYLVAVFVESAAPLTTPNKVEEKLREIQEKRGKEKENREKKKQAGKVDLVGIFGDPSKLLKHH